MFFPFRTTKIPFRVKKYFFIKISSIIVDEIFIFKEKCTKKKSRKYGRRCSGICDWS